MKYAACFFGALLSLSIVACGSGPSGPETAQSGEGPNAPNSAGDVGEDENLPVTAAPDDGTAQGLAPATTLEGELAATMRTTADVNFRGGPSTSDAILRVLPKGTIVTVVDATPTNSFLHVSTMGLQGFVSTKYLESVGGTPAPAQGPSADPNGAASPDSAIARAVPAVGFSYYWGGGAWLSQGPTAATKGSCSGTCPNCSHHGSYGADCSGLVAKAWQLGSKDLSKNEHPYSTADFVRPRSGAWGDISRSNTKKGDALTYNSGGHGHIVLYEKGDPWGTPVVYECKGCSYGCVYNARSFGNAYKAIRRAGF